MCRAAPGRPTCASSRRPRTSVRARRGAAAQRETPRGSSALPFVPSPAHAPVRLHLHVTQDHVLDGGGQAGHLQGGQSRGWLEARQARQRRASWARALGRPGAAAAKRLRACLPCCPALRAMLCCPACPPSRGCLPSSSATPRTGAAGWSWPCSASPAWRQGRNGAHQRHCVEARGGSPWGQPVGGGMCGSEHLHAAGQPAPRRRLRRAPDRRLQCCCCRRRRRCCCCHASPSAHPLRHHVQDVVHDGGAQLQVKVRLDALLCHRLGHALRSNRR